MHKMRGSPPLNPIEEAFSKVKTELKSIETYISDIETAVLASFSTISASDCRGWISHYSVYNVKLIINCCLFL